MAQIHKRLSSSRVTDAWYDPERFELKVAFPDGNYWLYQQVPDHVWDEFIYASSPGRFLNETLAPNYPGHPA